MIKIEKFAAFLLLASVGGCEAKRVPKADTAPVYARLMNKQIAVSVYVQRESLGKVIGTRMFGSVSGLENYHRYRFPNGCSVFHLEARIDGYFKTDEGLVVKRATDLNRISPERYAQLTGYDPRGALEDGSIC